MITGLDKDELIKIIGEYDGMAVRSSTKATPPVLEAAKNMKVIGRAGIGVDNIDLPTATQKGIVVMNTPFGNSITTAEHAIAMMFALAGKSPKPMPPPMTANGKNRALWGGTDRQDAGRCRLRQYRLHAATRALGLKMKVVAFDPFLTPERALKSALKKPSLMMFGARRFHHPAHAADRQNAQYHQCRGFGQMQKGRAHHQLRARRFD